MDQSMRGPSELQSASGRVEFQAVVPELLRAPLVQRTLNEEARVDRFGTEALGREQILEAGADL